MLQALRVSCAMPAYIYSLQVLYTGFRWFYKILWVCWCPHFHVGSVCATTVYTSPQSAAIDIPSLPLRIKFCPTVKFSSGLWLMEPQWADDLPSNSSVLILVSGNLCQIVPPASVTFSSTLWPHSCLSFTPYMSEIHTLRLNTGINMDQTMPDFLSRVKILFVFLIMELFSCSF